MKIDHGTRFVYLVALQPCYKVRINPCPSHSARTVSLVQFAGTLRFVTISTFSMSSVMRGSEGALSVLGD